MSYTAFGPWKDIAARLIYDDVPLSARFFDVRGDPRFAPYCLSLVDAAASMQSALKSKKPLVIPCMALLLVAPGKRIGTHAVLLVGDGERVRLFDPNGRYPAAIRYFVRGRALTSKQIAPFLRDAAGSDARWTTSRRGIQGTIREAKNTRFVPNRGYCMFLCRALMDLLRSQPNEAGENPIASTKRFEKISCEPNRMGQVAKSILQDIWPVPSRASR